MDVASAIDHHQNIPEFMKGLIPVHQELDKADVDKKLAKLIVLRASQMNGCAYCVNMHLAEARARGESNDRLDRLIVWRNVSDFSDAEKAALAWTEALTSIDSKAHYEPLRQTLKKHFSEPAISAMTFSIALINMWNRIAVSNHA